MSASQRMLGPPSCAIMHTSVDTEGCKRLLIIMNTFDYRGDGALPAPHRRKENGAKNKYVTHQLKHH